MSENVPVYHISSPWLSPDYSDRHTFYVDASGGSDSNTGKTSDEAWKTISKVNSFTFESGDLVLLKRGSEWREQLTISIDDLAISSYSTGAKPILNASDIVSGWSKTAGRTNVYELSVVLEGDGIGDWVNAWEDGDFLTRAASVAACDAAAGSYFPTAETGTITLYVHPNASTVPDSDGKIYEVSVREQGIMATAQNGITVREIEMKNNLGESGSFRALRGCALIDCIFRNGSKHNALIGDGAYVYGCTFVDAYYGAVSGNQLILNENSPASIGYIIQRCSFQSTDFNALLGGLLSHKNVGGDFGAVLVNDCTFTNLQLGIECQDVTSVAISDCAFLENGIAIRAGDAVVHTISDCVLTNVVNVGRLIATNSTGATFDIDDVTVRVNQAGPQGIVFINHDNTKLIIDDCDFEDTDIVATAAVIFVNNGLAGCTTTVNTSRIASNALGRNYIIKSGPYTGDYNTFYRGGGEPIMFYVATNYVSLALWQAAVTPQDANSTVEL